MEKDVTLSARVPGALAAQVDLLAEQYKRSRSSLVQEAIKAYVAGEKEFIRAVQEGIDAFERGYVVEHEVVAAAWEKRKKQLMRQIKKKR